MCWKLMAHASMAEHVKSWIYPDSDSDPETVQAQPGCQHPGAASSEETPVVARPWAPGTDVRRTDAIHMASLWAQWQVTTTTTATASTTTSTIITTTMPRSAALCFVLFLAVSIENILLMNCMFFLRNLVFGWKACVYLCSNKKPQIKSQLLSRQSCL